MNGPYHPHLHSSGVFTHPIILLFNALVTHKRIMFLGHGLPAGAVSQMVLAACALGSGCGGVLKGFVERAFPYSNLTIYEDFKSVYVTPLGLSPRVEILVLFFFLKKGIDHFNLTSDFQKSRLHFWSHESHL